MITSELGKKKDKLFFRSLDSLFVCSEPILQDAICTLNHNDPSFTFILIQSRTTIPLGGGVAIGGEIYLYF